MDWFFLALAHDRLGEREDAERWFKQAVEWMDSHQPDSDELRRFRLEAEETLKPAESPERP
jgi:hypothetical protein